MLTNPSKNEAEKKDISSSSKILPSAQETPVSTPGALPIPQVKTEEPYTYDTATLKLIVEKIAYILQLVNDKNEMVVDTYPDTPISFDRAIKRRWKYQEKIGFKQDSMITEEEFWYSFISHNLRYALKKGILKTLKTKNQQDIPSNEIENVTEQLNELSQLIADLCDKIQNPSKLRNEAFVFCGMEYRVTRKTKKLLIELERSNGLVTTKELSGRIHESEKYISKALFRLINYGYPITNIKESGKRFWALVRNENTNVENNSDVVKANSELVVHAMHLYNYLYGRPPSTSDIASLLKVEVISVKNELSRLESQEKVKSAKMKINGKKIKTWLPVAPIEKKDRNL